MSRTLWMKVGVGLIVLAAVVAVVQIIVSWIPIPCLST